MPTHLSDAEFPSATDAYYALVVEPLYPRLPIGASVEVVDNAEGCRDCYGHTLMHVAHRYDADSTENTVMTTISRDGTAHQDGQWLVSVETHVAGAPNKSVVTGYVSTPAQVTAFFAEHLPAALARLAAQLVTV